MSTSARATDMDCMRIPVLDMVVEPVDGAREAESMDGSALYVIERI
jgi:hypothetical protein